MKCATVRGEHEICQWLDHKSQGGVLNKFALGETWWGSKPSSIKMDPSLPNKFGQIQEASVLITGRLAELVRPVKKDKNTQLLVHLKIHPLLDGGVRYTTSLKKGRKIAERQLIVRNGDGKYSLHEMLVTMGDGDYVQATRTGKLWGEAEQITFRCALENNQLTVNANSAV